MTDNEDRYAIEEFVAATGNSPDVWRALDAYAQLHWHKVSLYKYVRDASAPKDYTPREVAQILCDNSPRCEDGGCTHTSSEVSK